MNGTLIYTNIIHQHRRAHSLSCIEYVLLDMVYHLQTAPGSAVKGWCYMKRERMADEIGISKQGLLNMIQKLIDGGFLVKHEETKHLQTTPKWQSIYCTEGKETLPPVQNQTEGKESLPTVKKLYQEEGKESLPGVKKVDPDGKETLPHDYIYYNNINTTTNEGESPEADLVEEKENSSPSSDARNENFALEGKKGEGEQQPGQTVTVEANQKKESVLAGGVFDLPDFSDPAQIHTPTVLAKDLRDDDEALAAFEQNYGLTSKQLNEALTVFVNNLIIGKKRKTRDDFRDHFNNWLKRENKAEEFKKPPPSPSPEKRHETRPKNYSSTVKVYD